jgi:glutathione peroxidase
LENAVPTQTNKRLPFIALSFGLGVLAVGVAVSMVQAQTRSKAMSAARPTPSLAPKAATAAPAVGAPTPALPAPARSNTRFDGLMGGQIDLASYRGKVVLVVNTASQCGFTGQYSGLERLYQARWREGLVIVGVPSNDFGGQEPGSAGEIKKFCELNYGVTFPMTAKNVVSGPRAHPFFLHAVARLGPSAEPAWNFHKILIGKNGQPVAAFSSGVTPQAPELSRAITSALAARS